MEASSKRIALEKDLITILPDDILIKILPFLTLKEAGITSVLSKRWRSLWAYVPSLIFDSQTSGLFLAEGEEPEYVSWVNQVVNSHKASTIVDFIIRFQFNDNHMESMNSWLRFVMERRVKRLVLDIGPCKRMCKAWSFTFPSLFFFSSLTSLELSSVDVTGEVLEQLLYDCQTLESLSVAFSASLVDLKVTGPSLNLKFLKIICCFGLKKLEISAPNLISFSYNGEPLSLHFKFIPKLTEVAICGYYATHWISNCADQWNGISQIEVLTIDSSCSCLSSIVNEFPVFQMLTTLHVTIDPMLDVVLFGLGPFIQACPSLQKFVLQLDYGGMEVKRTKRSREIKARPHRNLKTLEIVGFTGWKVDLAFSMYLIESAIALEKIIIEPVATDTPWETCAEDGGIRARKQAMVLFSQLKPGIEFEIREPK